MQNTGFAFNNEAGRANAMIVREGYLIKFQVKLSGMFPNSVPFSFSMIVTNGMNY